LLKFIEKEYEECKIQLDSQLDAMELQQKVREEPLETPKEIPPWEKIPDRNWDRKAVELWWKGYENSEISKRVMVEARSVTNRISILRQNFGTDIVPYNAERKKRIREKTRDTM
jgi:hypothetical protein